MGAVFYNLRGIPADGAFREAMQKLDVEIPDSAYDTMIVKVPKQNADAVEELLRRYKLDYSRLNEIKSVPAEAPAPSRTVS